MWHGVTGDPTAQSQTCMEQGLKIPAGKACESMSGSKQVWEAALSHIPYKAVNCKIWLSCGPEVTKMTPHEQT